VASDVCECGAAAGHSLGFETHPSNKTQFLPALPETVFEIDDAILVIVGKQVQRLIETQIGP